MKVHKKEIFFLLPLFFFYFVFYILLRYLPMDSILSKGLVVGNVLIYSPLLWQPCWYPCSMQLFMDFLCAFLSWLPSYFS